MSRADAGEKSPMSGRGRCVKWGGAPGITAHRQSALRLLCPILFACAGRRDRWPLWRAIGPLVRTQARRGSEERGGPLHLQLNVSPAAAVSYLQTKQLFFPSLLSPRYVRRSGEGLIISYFQQLLHSGRGKADLGSLLLVVLFVCPRCCCGGVMDGAPDEARLLIG